MFFFIIVNNSKESSFAMDFEIKIEQKDYSEGDIKIQIPLDDCHKTKTETNPNLLTKNENDEAVKGLTNSKNQKPLRSSSPKKVQSGILVSSAVGNKDTSTTLYEDESENLACPHCKQKFSAVCFLTRHRKTYGNSPQDCDLCQEKFCTILQLRRHKKEAHYITGKKCDMCPEIFRTPSILSRHMEQVHKGQKLPRVQCPKCNEWCRDKFSLKRHILKHNDEGSLFICNICQKISTNRITLRAHISYAHRMERKHECTLCDKKFKRKISLTQHLATHERKSLYKCLYCPHTDRVFSNLLFHCKKMHKKEYAEEKNNRYLHGTLISRVTISNNECQVKAEIGEQVLSETKMFGQESKPARDTKRNTKPPRVYACKFCDKEFKTLLSLKEHAARHTGIPLYTCSFCPLVFNSRSSLYKHRKVLHPKEVEAALLRGEKIKMTKTANAEESDGNFECVCKECGVTVEDFSSLVTHTKEVHQKEDIYDCKFCRRTFMKRNNLIKHMAGHNKEALYDCSYCSFRCSKLKQLKNHGKRLHPEQMVDLGPRTKRRNKSLSSLTTSALADRDAGTSEKSIVDIKPTYFCSECNFVAENLLALLFHKKKAHTVKPIYECNVCKRAFKTKVAYKEHMSGHEGVPLYNCSHCPEKFFAYVKFNLHRRLNHPQEFKEEKDRRQINKKTSSLAIIKTVSEEPATKDRNDCIAIKNEALTSTIIKAVDEEPESIDGNDCIVIKTEN